ncbi:MAG TPA: type II toxin-antitoxin system RelE/ParE family toxin [Humisphaera sp.]|nr:type II toxin-antitoxin system RelE/ParE family toxin [Humisphaera sp.]
MRLTLIQLSPFVAKWSKLGLTDEDLQSLESILIAKPGAGNVIPGTGGLRKLRFAPPSWHTGKRGGSRVIYAFIASGEAIYLFTLYGKNEQSDLTTDEKNFFRKVLNRLRGRAGI